MRIAHTVLIHPPTLEERADLDASRQLDRATRAARVFAQCSRARIHARDERELLSQLCRIVVDPGGYVQCYVGYARDDAGKTIAPVAEAGYERGYLARKRLTWSDDQPGLCGRAVRTGKPYLARHLLADPACAHLYARALERGFRSMISLPLRVDGRIIGGFSIYAREADAFDPEEVSLLTALTDDIAYGIGALRREAAREAAEGALRRVERARCVLAETGRVLIHASVEEEMLSRVCRIFVEAGGYRQAWIGAPARGSALPLRASAHAGYGSADGPMATHARAGGGKPGGLAREAFETGETQVARNVRTDPAYARKRARALELGYGSSIAFALRSEEAVVGVLVLHAAEDDAFDASELALLRDVAEEIGFGIGSLRLRESHSQAEARLLASERRLTAAAEIYRATFDHAPVGIMHNAADTEAVLKVNPKLCAMLGYSEEELLELKVEDIIHREDLHADRPKYRQQMLDGKLDTYSSERRLACKDGRPLWVYRTISLVRDASGAPSYFIRMMEDISERKRAEEAISVERALLRTVVDTIPERIYAKDREGRFRFQNVANVKAHGAAAAGELIGKTVFDVFPPEVAARMEAEDRAIMESGVPIMDRERMVSIEGEKPRWIASTKVPLPDGNGNIIGIVGVSRDITDRKRIEQELTHLAHFDVLTGLPNRASFGERLTEALAYARTNGWTTGVMFIDLDRFKDVNDTLGHAEGDKLLKQAADRLIHAVRRGDTVARLGGDEFAVVLTNLGAGEDAEIVARKIVASLSEPFQLAGTEACVSASIGISLSPGDALDEDTLVRSADAAMYAAKKAGRNGYRFHTAAVPTISALGKL